MNQHSSLIWICIITNIFCLLNTCYYLHKCTRKLQFDEHKIIREIIYFYNMLTDNIQVYNLDHLELYRITYIFIYEKSTILHTRAPTYTYIYVHTLFFVLIKTIIMIRTRLSTVCFYMDIKHFKSSTEKIINCFFLLIRANTVLIIPIIFLKSVEAFWAEKY